MDGGLPANWIGASGTGSRPAAMVTPRLVFRVDGSSLHRHQAANEPEAMRDIPFRTSSPAPENTIGSALLLGVRGSVHRSGRIPV